MEGWEACGVALLPQPPPRLSVLLPRCRLLLGSAGVMALTGSWSVHAGESQLQYIVMV
jgi:hypothetical protein